MRSEGDVIVRDALVSVVRCIGGGGRLSWAGGPVAAALTAARLAEEREFVDQNLGLVTLCARLLVVPRARLDLALDEELSALLHVVADDLRGTLERDQIVPLGLIDPVALRILRAIRSCEGKARDGHAAVGGANLRLFADVAEKKNFVNAFLPLWYLPPGSVELSVVALRLLNKRAGTNQPHGESFRQLSEVQADPALRTKSDR